MKRRRWERGGQLTLRGAFNHDEDAILATREEIAFRGLGGELKDGGHELGLGVEWDIVQLGVGLLLLVHADCHGGVAEQRGICGVSHHLSLVNGGGGVTGVLELGAVAHEGKHAELLHSLLHLGLRLLRINRPGHAKGPLVGEDRDDGDSHAVGRQGSGLVGANHVDTPQGLHNWQGLDKNLLLLHASGNDGQHQGNGNGKTLRNKGYQNTHVV